jgi:hypothetical protein
MSISTILVIVAIVLFALAAVSDRLLGTDRSSVDIVAAGLFFWALSTVV